MIIEQIDAPDKSHGKLCSKVSFSLFDLLYIRAGFRDFGAQGTFDVGAHGPHSYITES
jgi:hypothetical protein